MYRPISHIIPCMLQLVDVSDTHKVNTITTRTKHDAILFLGAIVTQRVTQRVILFDIALTEDRPNASNFRSSLIVEDRRVLPEHIHVQGHFGTIIKFITDAVFFRITSPTSRAAGRRAGSELCTYISTGGLLADHGEREVTPSLPASRYNLQGACIFRSTWIITLNLLVKL